MLLIVTHTKIRLLSWAGTVATVPGKAFANVTQTGLWHCVCRQHQQGGLCHLTGAVSMSLVTGGCEFELTGTGAEGGWSKGVLGAGRSVSGRGREEWGGTGPRGGGSAEVFSIIYSWASQHYTRLPGFAPG